MIRWNRQEIKEYAKDFLRNHYWKAFVVCLIVALLSGGGSSRSNRSNRNHISNDNYIMEQSDNGMFPVDDSSLFGNITRSIRSPFFLITRGMITGTLLLFGILIITVGYALEVGQSRFFLDGFKGDASISKLVSGFNSNDYFPIVKTQFLRKFYNFLWTLLLIIPGIIKSYEYYFVPYILAEEPNLPSNEVISRSRDMTYGHKMDIFVLDLSFIGWYLFGALFCGLGVFFVNPYREATVARLYNVLSGKDDFDNDFHGAEESFFDIVIE